MRAYQYRCKDYSLLTPAFKKVFIEPVIDYIPWGIPANIITIISNFLMYVAFVLALQKDFLGDLNYLVIPVLLMLYLIGDHLDGAQAKRTGTGSPLGEFCDHYLDAFNNGILMFILFALFDIENIWLVSGVLFTSYLAHVIVFYEQFKTGWLIFEKLGSLEGVILSAIMIALAYFEPVRLFYMMDLIGFTIFEWFLIATALGAVWTFGMTIKRIPDITYGLWLFVVTGLITAVLCSIMFSTLGVTVILSLYCSWYIGKLMQGYLVDGLERSPGLFTPLFLILAYLMESILLTNTFIILVTYMSLSIILLIYRTFSALKAHWVWVNPPKE